MEYGLLESSGTDDDNPQKLYIRGRVTGSGRSFVPSAPFQRTQINMEHEIHNLEEIAYCAVLRAFKAQSDALTWEKEGLITELRKELRVSDDEHRVLLSQVNGDDLILRIREWREAGENQNVVPNVPQHVNNRLKSSTVSTYCKRQKTSFPNPFTTPSQSLLSQSVAGSTLPLSSGVKQGPSSGVGGRRPNAGQPAFSSKPVQYQLGGHVSSGGPMEPSESVHEPLVGRRVMIRWPADSNFYEAVISGYNPVNGRHSLVYDSNTPNATVECVNIKEVPAEDIRWVGEDPVITQLGEAGIPNSGRRRTSSTNQYAKEMLPSERVMKDDSEEIEILHTDTLIKKVEKVLEASHPNALEIDKAKRMLKEHEQTLVQVIQKLVDACNSDDNEQQHNTDDHGPNNELDIGGRTGSHELGRG